MKENEMRQCFFCGIRNTEKMYKVTECEFLEGYRIAVGIPDDGPVGWAICDVCGQLDPGTLTSHIREDMLMRAVVRYRTGQPTIIVDDEMLKQFEMLAEELHKRNHAPQGPNRATCREGWHRAYTTKSVRTCPRCGGPIPNVKQAGLYPGGISRLDGMTEICGPCETDEAMSWPNDPWQEEAWAKEQRAKCFRKRFLTY